MLDLNSVLIEGTIQHIKEKRDHSGLWATIRNRRDKGAETGRVSHQFRIEIGSGIRSCPPEVMTVGRRIRVVGTLRRESRLGPFVRAEHVEVKAAPQEIGG
jgi:hypothetical protein